MIIALGCTPLSGLQRRLTTNILCLLPVERGAFDGVEHQGPVGERDGPPRGHAQGLRQKGEDAREKGKTKCGK